MAFIGSRVAGPHDPYRIGCLVDHEVIHRGEWKLFGKVRVVNDQAAVVAHGASFSTSGGIDCDASAQIGADRFSVWARRKGMNPASQPCPEVFISCSSRREVARVSEVGLVKQSRYSIVVLAQEGQRY
jgi:hypothetical protein